MNTELSVIGLMSGTSLDGIDAAYCIFEEKDNKWHYKVKSTKTYSYDPTWRHKLSNAHKLNNVGLIQLDREYGNYLGEIVNDFIYNTGLIPQLIASHGHTIFHKPDQGYTLQIGHGANILAATGIMVVSDFRSIDVALGGQGAPLVPAGDKLLYSEYDSCLNLGGFANISFEIEASRKAFDICPVNIILNFFARKFGFEFDSYGTIGRNGLTDPVLLKDLNDISYYKQSFPKSLGREWIDEIFMPVIRNSVCSDNDKIHTLYQHIAYQIITVIKKYQIKKVLITGGGVNNKYLIELLGQNSGTTLFVPDQQTVEFKEAIVFGFLGLLRYLGRINCYSSVTGASKDSCCGAIFTI